MAKVLGIGGIFFKAADPKAVRAWYARVLGLDIQDWGGVAFPLPDRGYSVWNVNDGSGDYFAPSSQPFMVNLMVDDLDGVLEKVRAEGEEVLGRQDDEGFGKFAWLMDPAGVKVELWEPAETSPFT